MPLETRKWETEREKERKGKREELSDARRRRNRRASWIRSNLYQNRVNIYKCYWSTRRKETELQTLDAWCIELRANVLQCERRPAIETSCNGIESSDRCTSDRSEYAMRCDPFHFSLLSVSLLVSSRALVTAFLFHLTVVLHSTEEATASLFQTDSVSMLSEATTNPVNILKWTVLYVKKNFFRLCNEANFIDDHNVAGKRRPYVIRF